MDLPTSTVKVLLAPSAFWRRLRGEMESEARELAARRKGPHARPPLASWQVDDLGTLGGELTEVAAINDSGVTVGDSKTNDGARHAFEWRDDRMIDLGSAGA